MSSGTNTDVLWYKYKGNGESDRSEPTGWHPRTGKATAREPRAGILIPGIRSGNGWQNFRRIFVGFSDSHGRGCVVYAVAQNGDLLWYKYQAVGQSDRSGGTGLHPISRNRSETAERCLHNIVGSGRASRTQILFGALSTHWMR